MKRTGHKKVDRLALYVDELAGLFRDPERAKDLLQEDDGGLYNLYLNRGDGEMVITAMVRRAEEGEFDLRALLDERRTATWREIAARNAGLRDQEMAAIAARLRRSAAARSKRVIAMLQVHDDAYDEAIASLTDADAERLLPGVTLTVEDQLWSYWLNVRVAGRPTAEGLAHVKRVFDDLARAKSLMLDLMPTSTPRQSATGYAVFDK